MKKLLSFGCMLTILFFVECPFAKAQSYKSIFGNNSTVWNVSFEQGDWYGTDSLRTTSDTVINMMNYKIVQDFGRYSSNLKYYIREDTVNGKYYIRSKEEFQNEYLFMDMGLNVGDTFVIHHDPYFSSDSIAIVDSVKYINNLKVIKTDYQIYTMSLHNPNYLTFYESTGPNSGLNYLFQNSPPHFTLLCHFKDDTLSYHNMQALESRPCFFEGGGYVPEFGNSLVKSVSPNPATDLLNMDFLKDFSGNILIYNMFGQKLFEKEIKSSLSYQINISDFPSGAYVVVLNAERNSSRLKFLKQ